MNDHQIAAELAEGAGKVLLKLRAKLVAEGVDPKQIKDLGDAGSQAWLARGDGRATARSGSPVERKQGTTSTG